MALGKFFCYVWRKAIIKLAFQKFTSPMHHLIPHRTTSNFIAIYFFTRCGFNKNCSGNEIGWAACNPNVLQNIYSYRKKSTKWLARRHWIIIACHLRERKKLYQKGKKFKHIHVHFQLFFPPLLYISASLRTIAQNDIFVINILSNNFFSTHGISTIMNDSTLPIR